MIELPPHEPYGILADTHDNKIPIEKALEVFRQNKVQCILHAGDLISPQILELFQNFQLYLSLGNNDSEAALVAYANLLNIPAPKKHWFFSAFGKKILLTHGDDPTFFREVTQPQNPYSLNYVIKGHTHFPEDYLRNNIRILNPGPLYRCARYSAALFWPSRNLWEVFFI